MAGNGATNKVSKMLETILKFHISFHFASGYMEYGIMAIDQNEWDGNTATEKVRSGHNVIRQNKLLVLFDSLL